MIPCLSVEGCFWVRNRIRKNAIRNLGHYQAHAPFTTTTKPEDPRQQPGYHWKALDQRSLLIPLLSFDYLFPVRNEIRKNGIGNLGHSQAHQTPDAFYNYYRTRRPQITTRVSLESPWQALSINTLVVIWVFVPSEERNSQKCNRKFGPFSSPPDAFYHHYYDYHRTRRPQMTTRVHLESPQQAFSSARSESISLSCLFTDRIHFFPFRIIMSLFAWRFLVGWVVG